MRTTGDLRGEQKVLWEEIWRLKSSEWSRNRKREMGGCQFIEKGRTQKTERSEESTHLPLNSTRKMVDFLKRGNRKTKSRIYTLSLKPPWLLWFRDYIMITAQPGEWDTPRVRKRVSAEQWVPLKNRFLTWKERRHHRPHLTGESSSPSVRVGTGVFFCVSPGSFTLQTNIVQPLGRRDGRMGVFRVSF